MKKALHVMIVGEAGYGMSYLSMSSKKEPDVVFGSLSKKTLERGEELLCPSCKVPLMWKEKLEKYQCPKCEKTYNYWEVIQ